MANEATEHIRYGPAISMACIDVNESHEKGALLKLIDPFTVSGGGTLTDGLCAGIAAVEKIRGYNTRTSVFRNGIWKMTLSGACTVGDILCMASAANKVYAQLNGSGATFINCVGYALETGADGETILVELNPTKLPRSNG